jgi:hypothetical protein
MADQREVFVEDSAEDLVPLIYFKHWLHSDVAINAVPVRTGRGRLHDWRAVKTVHRLVNRSLTIFKIIFLHLILNIRGVPHRISIGKTIEDYRDGQ